MSATVGQLTARAAQPGRIVWIGARTERRGPIQSMERSAIELNGLAADHRARPGKRAVTLFQWEHLGAIGAFLGRPPVSPEDLRRNIGVAGLNLLGLRNRTFRVGTALLRGSGLAAPCSRMEETFGHGGYAAVRGHGGVTAEVLEPGEAAIGDAVRLVETDAS
ncbi:MAG: MOSC domain-containing protein [Pseudomonadota bacterium]